MTTTTLSHTFCHVCDVVKEVLIKTGKSISRGCIAFGVARCVGELSRNGHYEEARKVVLMWSETTNPANYDVFERERFKRLNPYDFPPK